MEKTKFHYWVGNKSGTIMALDPKYTPKKKNEERLKYMGWTHDIGWPKKMNTGRILYKMNDKSFKKLKKINKLSARLHN